MDYGKWLKGADKLRAALLTLLVFGGIFGLLLLGLASASDVGSVKDPLGQMFAEDVIVNGTITVGGVEGLTDTTNYEVCTSRLLVECLDWCTLQINNGLITGCE